VTKKEIKKDLSVPKTFSYLVTNSLKFQCHVKELSGNTKIGEFIITIAK
jgi:hypothetical protein